MAIYLVLPSICVRKMLLKSISILIRASFPFSILYLVSILAPKRYKFIAKRMGLIVTARNCSRGVLYILFRTSTILLGQEKNNNKGSDQKLFFFTLLTYTTSSCQMFACACFDILLAKPNFCLRFFPHGYFFKEGT